MFLVGEQLMVVFYSMPLLEGPLRVNEVYIVNHYIFNLKLLQSPNLSGCNEIPCHHHRKYEEISVENINTCFVAKREYSPSLN